MEKSCGTSQARRCLVGENHAGYLHGPADCRPGRPMRL